LRHKKCKLNVIKKCISILLNLFLVSVISSLFSLSTKNSNRAPSELNTTVHRIKYLPSIATTSSDSSWLISCSLKPIRSWARTHVVLKYLKTSVKIPLLLRRLKATSKTKKDEPNQCGRQTKLRKVKDRRVSKLSERGHNIPVGCVAIIAPGYLRH